MRPTDWFWFWVGIAFGAIGIIVYCADYALRRFGRDEYEEEQ